MSKKSLCFLCISFFWINGQHELSIWWWRPQAESWETGKSSVYSCHKILLQIMFSLFGGHYFFKLTITAIIILHSKSRKACGCQNMSQQRCWKHFRLEDQKPNNFKPITKKANKGSCNECGHPIPGLIYNMRNYQNMGMGKHMYECYYERCTKKTGFLRILFPFHTSSPEIVSKKC